MTNKILFIEKKNCHFTFQTQDVTNVGDKWSDKKFTIWNATIYNHLLTIENDYPQI